MKKASLFCLAATLYNGADAADAQGPNPVSKAVTLLQDLSAKITKDGVSEEKAMNEYLTWCATAKQEQGFEIDEAKDAGAESRAEISRASATSGDAAVTIKSLIAAIEKDNTDLAKATQVRDGEKKDFQAQEKDLTETIDTLGRALQVLENELKGKTEVKPSDKAALLSTLSQVVEASSISLSDKSKLESFVQSDELEEAYDKGPVPKAYEQQSHGILEVLEELEEKAERELSEIRAQDQKATNAYDMLSQSLKQRVSVAQSQLKKQKAVQAEADRKAAAATDAKNLAANDLKEARKILSEVSISCKEARLSREQSILNRDQELKAIKTALDALAEYTGGAVNQLYAGGAPPKSFIQISSSKSGTPDDMAIVQFQQSVRQAAEKDHSVAMAQISKAVSQAARLGTKDFTRVVDLIDELIKKLMKEAAEDNKKKEYCDNELTKTGRKANSLSIETDKLTSRKDIAVAKVKSTNNQINKANEALAKIAESQAEADKIRADEKAAYDQLTKDVKFGLEGVRIAMKVLKDYYRNRGVPGVSFVQVKEHQQLNKIGQPAAPIFHAKDSSSGMSILGMLEIVESDMAKSVSTSTMDEEAAIREYKLISQENAEHRTSKSSDVSYMSKAVASLEKLVRDYDSDLATTKSETEANNKYMKELEEDCSDQGPTYQERQAQRDLEIKNLKDALVTIGGGEAPAAEGTALLQSSANHLRGRH
eukprot:TRINITY_DN63989_c0_g1_i1.p1 TRINITY_DN63989_c0_g1~~TRINITY_DN63989_c0_g1_i1.p1  ORF type:complete len:711 (+),score=226.53 TRINITY_DN63989_c0_g1_i1:83-2215(+)